MWEIVLPVLVILALVSCAAAFESGPAPVWPSSPFYRIARVKTGPSLDGEAPPDHATWRDAEPLGAFFSNGAIEAPGRRTHVRMLSSGGVLYVSAKCEVALDERKPVPLPAGEDAAAEALAFCFTETSEALLPYTEIRVTPDGACTATRYYRSRPRWKQAVPAEPLDASGIRVRTGGWKHAWWVVIAIPAADFAIPDGPFRANFVRYRDSDWSRFAWADLGNAPLHNPYGFGLMAFVDAPLPAHPRLELPAALAVGVNRLHIPGWKPGRRLTVAGSGASVDNEGQAVVEIRDRGAVDINLVDPGGTTLESYRADVRRPLVIEAENPFAPLGKPLPVMVTINIASGAEADLTLEAFQRETVIATTKTRLASGAHRLGLDMARAEADEITILASAEIPTLSGKPIRLSARHWCMAGVRREDVDRFRAGIEDLPTKSLYRAGLADACGFYRLIQAGDGRYRTMREDGGLGFTEWNFCYVYAYALVYKTAWPENPYAGDERFLASAIAGMEAGLDPGGTYVAGGYSRHLQAYVLTYELLRNDVEPERAEYWRARLAELIQHAIDSYVEPAKYVNAYYSYDVGTGTNHYAYYCANVYAAGRALGRPDWLELGKDALLRLAGHERDGQFAERRGVPATHYTWLTMNALGEYFAQSGDQTVRPALERCAEFSCHTSLPNNDIILLHDGRNNTYHPYMFGDFVLSLTPHGRHLARKRATACISSRLHPSGQSPEYWFRAAENALHFEDGPEEPLPADAEYAFLDGRAVVVRRQGFIYGLSAIPLPPTNEQFWLDPQNAIELHHESIGPILHGANSLQQPEAGSFMKRAGERTIFMPIEGEVEKTYDGHTARLVFDGFSARIGCRVTSDKSVEVKVELLSTDGDGPVIYSFFPAANPDEPLVEDGGKLLTLGKFRIRSNRPVDIERNFRITSP